MKLLINLSTVPKYSISHSWCYNITHVVRLLFIYYSTNLLTIPDQFPVSQQYPHIPVYFLQWAQDNLGK